MKKNIFTSLGLMSGTSMDGVDLSVIKSDGFSKVEQLYDKYYEFDDNLHHELINLRDNLNKFEDLKTHCEKIKDIDKKFTLFNCKIVNKLVHETGLKVDLVGFHGQTILHLPREKISEQLGDGNLMSQLLKCSVVNKFRQNDLDNYGQGAPLTPIFHNFISKKLNNNFNLEYPIDIINIGGITNVSQIINDGDLEQNIFAYDIAPGNCLIDEWLRKNSNKKYDENGNIANSGTVDDLILNQAIENFEFTSIKESLDIKNFDLSFVKGLTLENGCATLTKFTAYLISEGLKKIDKTNNLMTKNYILCGGGRKNKSLIKYVNEFMNEKKNILKEIDLYQIDGDFVESQAFAYLAIRSFLNLPISFPNTTRCKKPITGGMIIKNF
jgi:anhydro-N-acetylmuramic acid kinase